MQEENTLSIEEVNVWLDEYHASDDEKTKKRLIKNPENQLIIFGIMLLLFASKSFY